MFPFKDVAAVEHIDTPLSNEMIGALDLITLIQIAVKSPTEFC